MKDCEDCKHTNCNINEEPCKSCFRSGIVVKSGWEPITEPTCEWQQDEDGLYHTECGNIFWLDSGTPAENGWLYCPYCGKPIKQVEPKSLFCTFDE